MLRLFAILICAAALALAARAQEVRLALVIGQTEYTGDLSRIGQAEYEAGLIEDSLRSVGFSVTSRRNLSQYELEDALDDFRIRLEQAGRNAVGFVYYTGHGAQHPQSQDSYLLGIDAKLRGASDLNRYGVDMQGQRDGFAGTGAKAVFLVFDACRNTPAIPGWKASYKGLSRVEAASDMLIAYSTSLGDVATEGVYAPVLADELKRSGQSAEAAFSAAQRRVAEATGRDQLPWYNPLLYSEVCFAGCAGDSIEFAALGIAMAEGGTGALQDFLEQYPETERRAFVEREIHKRSVDVITVTGTRPKMPTGQITRPQTKLIATLSGHHGDVIRATFSPDHSSVASASEDGTARVWNLSSGKAPVIFSGHGKPVLYAGISPDNTRVISGDEDEKMVLWDAKTSQVLAELPETAAWLVSAAFSPDGSLVATAAENKTASIWDAQSGKLLRVLSGHSSSVYVVAFSRDGSLVATGSADGSARVWDVATGRMIKSLWGHEDEITAVTFGPDGTKIVTASADEAVRVWDVESGETLLMLTGSSDDVTSIEVSPGGTRILTQDWQTVKLWDAQTGRLLHTDGGEAGRIFAASFGTKPNQVYLVTGEKTLKVLELVFTD